MKAILDSGATSMQSLPVRTTGQDFLHSCRHFFGLHCRVEEVSVEATKRKRSGKMYLVATDNSNTIVVSDTSLMAVGRRTVLACPTFWRLQIVRAVFALAV